MKTHSRWPASSLDDSLWIYKSLNKLYFQASYLGLHSEMILWCTHFLVTACPCTVVCLRMCVMSYVGVIRLQMCVMSYVGVIRLQMCVTSCRSYKASVYFSSTMMYILPSNKLSYSLLHIIYEHVLKGTHWNGINHLLGLFYFCSECSETAVI